MKFVLLFYASKFFQLDSWKLINMINRKNQKRVNGKAFPPIPNKAINNSHVDTHESVQNPNRQSIRKQKTKNNEAYQSIKQSLVNRRKGSRSFESNPYKYQYSKRFNKQAEEDVTISRRKSTTLKRQQTYTQASRIKALSKQDKNKEKNQLIDNKLKKAQHLRSSQASSSKLNPLNERNIKQIFMNQQQLQNCFKKRQKKDRSYIIDNNKLKPSISMRKFIIKKLNSTKENLHYRHPRQETCQEGKIIVVNNFEEQDIVPNNAIDFQKLSSINMDKIQLQQRKKSQNNLKKQQNKIYRKQNTIKIIRKKYKEMQQLLKEQSESPYQVHKKQIFQQNRKKASSMKIGLPIAQQNFIQINDEPSIEIQISQTQNKINALNHQSLTQRVYETGKQLKENINENNRRKMEMKKQRNYHRQKENKEIVNKIVTIKSVNYDQNDSMSQVSKSNSKKKRPGNKLKCRVGKVKWGEQCRIKQNILEENQYKQQQIKMNDIDIVGEKQLNSPTKIRNLQNPYSINCPDISPIINKIQASPYQKNIPKCPEIRSFKQMDLNTNFINQSVGGISRIQDYNQQAPIESLADLYQMMAIGFKH